MRVSRAGFLRTGAAIAITSSLAPSAGATVGPLSDSDQASSALDPYLS